MRVASVALGLAMAGVAVTSPLPAQGRPSGPTLPEHTQAVAVRPHLPDAIRDSAATRAFDSFLVEHNRWALSTDRVENAAGPRIALCAADSLFGRLWIAGDRLVLEVGEQRYVQPAPRDVALAYVRLAGLVVGVGSAQQSTVL